MSKKRTATCMDCCKEDTREKGIYKSESWVPLTPPERVFHIRLRPRKIAATGYSSSFRTPTQSMKKSNVKNMGFDNIFSEKKLKIIVEEKHSCLEVELEAGPGRTHTPVTPNHASFKKNQSPVNDIIGEFPATPDPNTRTTCKRILKFSAKPENEMKDDQCPEEAGKDEKALWDDEIRLYAARVASFLHRMHLTQGNRRYSGWKGSVVDSVIGAFMSQNVADQSSSTAFMKLAAKYGSDGPLPANRSVVEIDWVKRRRATLRNKNKKTDKIDWDRLRRVHCRNGSPKKNHHYLDSLNWEAVRVAFPEEVSEAIMERGMHEKLGKRIQGFLERLIRDHGNLDLEWLKSVPSDQVKEFLMSIEGLGLKSMECIRLLALQQPAFPVDTNVARVAARLGWVPVKSITSVPLHRVLKYPARKLIHKYLWQRLSNFDVQTLYELHCHMITFGKVFCTKIRPNCNACPMRGECRHFASEFASTKLAYPRSMGKSQENSMESVINDKNLELETDIEDLFNEDSNGIPSIEFKVEDFIKNMKKYLKENNMLHGEVDVEKALVALNSRIDVTIPMPKMKIAGLLRTKHEVFELPDSHPLLNGIDKRDPDDPCPYMLSILKPDEFARTNVQTCKCNTRKPGEPCNDIKCCSCNNSEEDNPVTVLGILLIPCRTAMRGRFPLNGTHFQVNEVFSDDESSRDPMEVPWELIHDLQRQTLYCGTSTSSILKGFTTREIQTCFWRGFVCFRGFNRKTRRPTPLADRLHPQPIKRRKKEKKKDLKHKNVLTEM